MAVCPVVSGRGYCLKGGVYQGYEIIQWGHMYKVYICKQGHKFAADPRPITNEDKETIAYALADRP